MCQKSTTSSMPFANMSADNFKIVYDKTYISNWVRTQIAWLVVGKVGGRSLKLHICLKIYEKHKYEIEATRLSYGNLYEK